MSMMPSYVGGASTANNPYGQYAAAMSGFGGDQSAALAGTGSAQNNLLGLQTQQQQLVGDGGNGYTVGNGNDTTGSNYGNSLSANSNPWSQMSMPSQPAGLMGSNGTGVTPTSSTSSTSASYPTYPNSSGIGSGTGGQPSMTQSFASSNVPSGGANNSNAVQSSAPQATTTGFNPWSLQGEANTRIQ